MAKYILTASSDRPTGSRGGATFQRAGKIFVIRRRNVPTQKRTSAQSHVKNNFDYIQKRWRSLSPGQKVTFNNQAPNYPRVDSLGNPYLLSGSNLQSASNLNLSGSQLPLINNAAPPQPFPGLGTIAAGVEVLTQTVILQITPNPIPAGFACRIYVTRPTLLQSIQQNALFNLIATYAPGENQIGANWFTQWSAIFGNGENFIDHFFTAKAVFINVSTGEMSSAVYELGEVLNI